MTLGTPKHKAEFLLSLKKETAENIWKNELQLLRLTDELTLLRKERTKLTEQLEAKGKPATNAEKKQLFVLDRTIEHKEKDVSQVEETKKYNEYLLNDLIPRYESQA